MIDYSLKYITVTILLSAIKLNHMIVIMYMICIDYYNDYRLKNIAVTMYNVVICCYNDYMMIIVLFAVMITVLFAVMITIMFTIMFAVIGYNVGYMLL